MRRRGGARASTRAEAWGEGAAEWRAMDVVDPFDRAIEWGLYGLLAFMPLALGAVHAWSELVVMIAVAGLAMLLAVKLVVRRAARLVLVLDVSAGGGCSRHWRCSFLALPRGWSGRSRRGRSD